MTSDGLIRRRPRPAWYSNDGNRDRRASRRENAQDLALGCHLRFVIGTFRESEHQASVDVERDAIAPFVQILDLGDIEVGKLLAQ